MAVQGFSRIRVKIRAHVSVQLPGATAWSSQMTARGNILNEIGYPYERMLWG